MMASEEQPATPNAAEEALDPFKYFEGGPEKVREQFGECILRILDDDNTHPDEKADLENVLGSDLASIRNRDFSGIHYSLLRELTPFGVTLDQGFGKFNHERFAGDEQSWIKQVQERGCVSACTPHGEQGMDASQQTKLFVLLTAFNQL